MSDEEIDNEIYAEGSPPTGSTVDSGNDADSSEGVDTERIELGTSTDSESEMRDWALDEMPETPYHNRTHVETLLSEVDDLAVSDDDRGILRLATYFHDIGYREGAENHEERSAEVAEERLSNEGYDDKTIEKVSDAIRDTELFKEPETRFGAILTDIDTHNFACDWEEFKETSLAVKEEENPDSSTDDWWETTLGLLEAHSYHSEVGQKRYASGKQETIERLKEEVGDD